MSKGFLPSFDLSPCYPAVEPFCISVNKTTDAMDITPIIDSYTLWILAIKAVEPKERCRHSLEVYHLRDYATPSYDFRINYVISDIAGIASAIDSVMF